MLGGSAIVEHASGLRGLARTVSNAVLRQELPALADRLEMLAVEIANDEAREDGLALPEPRRS